MRENYPGANIIKLLAGCDTPSESGEFNNINNNNRSNNNKYRLMKNNCAGNGLQQKCMQYLSASSIFTWLNCCWIRQTNKKKVNKKRKQEK